MRPGTSSRPYATQLFAGLGLDRSTGDRKDASFLATALASGDYVAFHNGKPAVKSSEGGGLSIAWCVKKPNLFRSLSFYDNDDHSRHMTQRWLTAPFWGVALQV